MDKGLFFIDFTQYTYIETLTLIGVIGIFAVVVIVLMTQIIKSILRRNITIKDWVKIEGNERTFKNAKDNSKAVMLNKEEVLALLSDARKDLMNKLEEAEALKIKSIVFFGSIFESSINYCSNEYLNVYEALLINSRKNIHSVEQDENLYKEYYKFRRILKNSTDTTRLKLNKQFCDTFEKCLDGKKTSNCMDAKKVANFIVSTMKKEVSAKYSSPIINVKIYFEKVSNVDIYLRSHIAEELENVSVILDKTLEQTIDKFEEVENSVENMIRQLFGENNERELIPK